MTLITPEYPNSWYRASNRATTSAKQQFQGDVLADVCVIGAGYTGLSAALHLAKAGKRVVILEAARVGWGASGRNGGHVGTGQRADQFALEKWYGKETAKELWRLETWKRSTWSNRWSKTMASIVSSVEATFTMLPNPRI